MKRKKYIFSCYSPPPDKTTNGSVQLGLCYVQHETKRANSQSKGLGGILTRNKR